MAGHSDAFTTVIEWLAWLTLSKHGKGELFSPSLESVNMVEQEDLLEVLAKENQEFHENLVASHTYSTFFYYIPRFIEANFDFLCFRHFS